MRRELPRTHFRSDAINMRSFLSARRLGSILPQVQSFLSNAINRHESLAISLCPSPPGHFSSASLTSGGEWRRTPAVSLPFRLKHPPVNSIDFTIGRVESFPKVPLSHGAASQPAEGALSTRLPPHSGSSTTPPVSLSLSLP